MEIPDTLVHRFNQKFKEDFKSIYDEFLYESTNIEFQDFMSGVMNEVIDEVDNLIEVTFDNVYTYQKRRSVTKKRWYKKEISEELELYKEVEIVAKSLFEDVLRKDESQFENIYKCKNPKELKKLRIKELEKWVEDNELPLSHFRYLKGKNKQSIVSAFTNDIKYSMFKKMHEKFPRGKQSAISKLPISITNLPIDYTGRAKSDRNEVIEVGREKYFIDKYHITDTKILESRMNVEVLKTGMLQQVLKWLNQKDIEIFKYCMSLVDEKFYTTREIIVDIGDIVRNVYPKSDSVHSYMSVKESLYRMQYLNSGVVDGSLRGFTTKILDNVEIYSTDESRKETAKIIVNIDIVNEYIKNNTISYYSDIIEQFKLPASKIAIYPIQRERVGLDTITPDAEKTEEIKFETNYNFFRGILFFSNKKKKKNIETIEKMLDEIVESNFAIKGYERKGDKFTIKFYPITPQERKDLLSQQGIGEIIGEPVEDETPVLIEQYK